MMLRTNCFTLRTSLAWKTMLWLSAPRQRAADNKEQKRERERAHKGAKMHEFKSRLSTLQLLTSGKLLHFLELNCFISYMRTLLNPFIRLLYESYEVIYIKCLKTASATPLAAVHYGFPETCVDGKH